MSANGSSHPKAEPPEGYIDIASFCEKWRMSRQTFWRQSKRGKMPALTQVTPRRKYIAIEEMRRWERSVKGV